MTDSKQINDGGPAFPCVEEVPSSYSGVKCTNHYTGMSLRDWFAGQIITGIIGAPDWGGNSKTAAISAYQIADAMMTAREQNQ